MDRKYEDELEFMEILLAIWRWKYLIIGITTFIMSATFFVVLFAGNIYRASMIIKPAILISALDGSEEYVESPENIKNVIDSKIFNQEIAAKNKIETFSPDTIFFDVEAILSLRQLRVSTDQLSSDLAVNNLKSLFDLLNQHYYSKVDKHKTKQQLEINKIYEKTLKIKRDTNLAIEENKNQKKLILIEKSYLRMKKDNIETKIGHIDSKIIDAEIKIEKFQKQYEIWLGLQRKSSTNYSDGVVSTDLLRNDRVFRMESHLDVLGGMVRKWELDKMNKYDEKDKIDFEIETLNSNLNIYEKRFLVQKDEKSRELTLLEQSKNMIQDEITKINLMKSKNEIIQLLNPKGFSASTVKPKIIVKLIVAFVAGVLISLLLVSFLEYLKRYKNHERNLSNP